MKPEHGLWLMLAAMAFVALGSFVSSRTGAEQLIQLAFGAAVVYLAVSQTMGTTQRLVLWIAAIALAVPPLITWLQLPPGTLLVSDSIMRCLLWARSVIVGGTAMFFGFAASGKLWSRLLVAALGLAWLAFITFGPPQVTDPLTVLLVLLVCFIVWCYWANNYLMRGTHTGTDI